MPGRFFDTNILLHIASGDVVKADRAEAIWGRDKIGVQGLNQLGNVVRRKMQLAWPEPHAFLVMLRDLLTVLPISIETHETGLAIAQRYNLSTYDATIVASAMQAGCDRLWSEHMHQGMTLPEGLRIVNPFRNGE